MNPIPAAAAEMPPSAFANAATDGDRLRFLLQYAVRAPSVYNTQPWRFEVAQDHVDLYTDRARALPVIDPQGRQRILSCGAALFYLRTAIHYCGHADQVALFPDGPDADLLARVTLGDQWPATQEDQLLFAAIPQRHTARQPFADWPLPQALLWDLEAAAATEGTWLHLVDTPAGRLAFSELVVAGDRQLWANPAFRVEMARHLAAGQHAPADGLAYAGAPDPFLVQQFDLGHSQAEQDQQWLAEAPGLAVLGTPADDPAAWLAAGQGLAHVLLHAAAHGVSAAFLNRPIEIPTLRTDIGRLVERHGNPQVLIRLGYAQVSAPTGRRPLSAAVLSPPEA